MCDRTDESDWAFDRVLVGVGDAADCRERIPKSLFMAYEVSVRYEDSRESVL